jgi:hypothetical protein
LPPVGCTPADPPDPAAVSGVLSEDEHAAVAQITKTAKTLPSGLSCHMFRDASRMLPPGKFRKLYRCYMDALPIEGRQPPRGKRPLGLFPAVKSSAPTSTASASAAAARGGAVKARAHALEQNGTDREIAMA